MRYGRYSNRPSGARTRPLLGCPDRCRIGPRGAGPLMKAPPSGFNTFLATYTTGVLQCGLLSGTMGKPDTGRRALLRGQTMRNTARCSALQAGEATKGYRLIAWRAYGEAGLRPSGTWIAGGGTEAIERGLVVL